MPGVLFALTLAACSHDKKPDAVSADPQEQPAAETLTADAPQPKVKPRGKKTQETKSPAPESAVPQQNSTASQQETPPVEPSAVAPAPALPALTTTPADEKLTVPSVPGKRIARVRVPGPYVAVTFDDGPSASLTPRVLDIFNRHGAHATFFVQGQNATRHRSLLARAVAEGHEIGSHTWNHINMRKSSASTIINQLDRTAEVIEEATGSRPRVMRPPYGSVNSSLVNMVYNRYGTPVILWDVDTNDWRKPGVATVVRRAVNGARPGSIILLHDIHASTVAAAEDIVTGLQARGFKLVTVSELIALGSGNSGAAAPQPAPLAVDAGTSPAAEPHAVSAVAQPAATEAVGAACISAAPAVVPTEPVAEVAPTVPAAPAEMPAGEENDPLFDDLY